MSIGCQAFVEVGPTEKGHFGMIKKGFLGKGRAFKEGVSGELRRFSCGGRGQGMVLESGLVQHSQKGFVRLVTMALLRGKLGNL